MSTEEGTKLNGDEVELHELITRWAKAVREENVTAIRADHDSDILMFDVPPPLMVRGLDAYMQTWKPFFAWSERPILFDLQDVRITAGSDVAFATAIGHCRGKDVSSQTTDLQFRLTMGFRKRNGHWYIVHEHHSVPAAD